MFRAMQANRDNDGRRMAIRHFSCAMAAMAVLAAAFCSNAALAGIGPLSWFDNFDDMNVTDGNPVTWSPNPPTGLGPIFPGDYNATTGDYALSGQNIQGGIGLFDDDDEVLIATVEDVEFTDGVSVRISGAALPFSGIGVLANINSLTLTTYFGIFHNDGTDDGMGNGVPVGFLEFSRFDGTQGEVEFAEIEPLDPILDPDDVVVQLDVFNGVVELRYWVAGEVQPADPQASVMDSTYTSGVAGIVYNEDSFNGAGEGVGIFRWAKAASVKLIDGDMDADGDVDFDDIAGFVLGLNDPAAYEAATGLSPVMMGDTDNDGDQDFDDIGLFVELLTTATQAASVPEPSTLVLAAGGVLGLVLAGLRRGRRSVE